jgi:hypothetical protein
MKETMLTILRRAIRGYGRSRQLSNMAQNQTRMSAMREEIHPKTYRWAEFDRPFRLRRTDRFLLLLVRGLFGDARHNYLFTKRFSTMNICFISLPEKTLRPLNHSFPVGIATKEA